jgi:hypothetical protein
VQAGVGEEAISNIVDQIDEIGNLLIVSRADGVGALFLTKSKREPDADFQKAKFATTSKTRVDVVQGRCVIGLRYSCCSVYNTDLLLSKSRGR